ncbi:MAG: sulfurtransferase-like selenium metabolism protein YedF [Desulfovibrionaceae bacterium]
MQKELDCRGLTCPQPVMETRTAIADAAVDGIAVLVDNTAASENVRRFLENNGFAAAVDKVGDSLWRVTGTRGCQGACAVTEPLPAKEAARGRTLVFISTDTLGRGNDELGGKLMGNFIATLPELGARLWRVVLVNGGVKLAAREGKALDGLRALEQAGVRILVCGTCLEFYGLSEAKQVGETTNMLDIVTSLDLADKVLRP